MIQGGGLSKEMYVSIAKKKKKKPQAMALGRTEHRRKAAGESFTKE